MTVVSIRRATPDGVSLDTAVSGYLDQISNRNTRKSYSVALSALVHTFGADTDVRVFDDDATADAVAVWFAERWGTLAPATVNVRLDALRSAAAWWHHQGWIAGDPVRRVRRRADPPARDRAIDRAVLERFLTRDGHALRERTLWRLLYESAARGTEILGLDGGDLDLSNRRARVRRKGGAVDVITWRTATARLLPRLLRGRRDGPVFLTERRARLALAAADLDPTGRARLSERRAAELFTVATAGESGGPWTLHRLRHSALTHAAEDGAATPVLLAYSGHTSVRSLARYARVGPGALAQWQAQRDPATRRH